MTDHGWHVTENTKNFVGDRYLCPDCIHHNHLVVRGRRQDTQGRWRDKRVGQMNCTKGVVISENDEVVRCERFMQSDQVQDGSE